MAARAASGDQKAFAVLAERYSRYIYTIVYRIVLSKEDALDLTQEVLLRLTEKIKESYGGGNFRAWVSTIAVREAIDHCRCGATIARGHMVSVAACDVGRGGNHTVGISDIRIGFMVDVATEDRYICLPIAFGEFIHTTVGIEAAVESDTS